MSPSSRKRQPRRPASSPAPRPRPGAPRPTAKKPPRPADSSTRATRVLQRLLQRLPARYREKALDYLVLTRMDRAIGALLLLWPTWWALWLAAGDFPPWKALIIFTLGVFAMRAAGCAINDYADPRRWRGRLDGRSPAAARSGGSGLVLPHPMTRSRRWTGTSTTSHAASAQLAGIHVMHDAVGYSPCAASMARMATSSGGGCCCTTVSTVCGSMSPR